MAFVADCSGSSSGSSTCMKILKDHNHVAIEPQLGFVFIRYPFCTELQIYIKVLYTDAYTLVVHPHFSSDKVGCMFSDMAA